MARKAKSKLERALDEAREMGRRGATPHDAYDVAESYFGSGRGPKGSPERRAFTDAYREAFDAAGWQWVIRDWNARRNASGTVERRG